MKLMTCEIGETREALLNDWVEQRRANVAWRIMRRWSSTSLLEKIRIYQSSCWTHSSPILVKFRKIFLIGFQEYTKAKDYKYFANAFPHYQKKGTLHERNFAMARYLQFLLQGMEGQGQCNMETVYSNVGVHCGLLALKYIVRKILSNKVI